MFKRKLIFLNKKYYIKIIVSASGKTPSFICKTRDKNTNLGSASRGKYLFMIFSHIYNIYIQTGTNIDYDFVQAVVTTTRNPILTLIIQFNASPQTSR